MAFRDRCSDCILLVTYLVILHYLPCCFSGVVGTSVVIATLKQENNLHEPVQLAGWLGQELGTELQFSRRAASALTAKSVAFLPRISLGD